MSGGGGTSKSVTQNYSPEEAARRAQVMKEAEAIYAQTKGQYQPGTYPGSRVVPFDQATLAGQQSALTAAGQAAATNAQLNSGLSYGLSTAMDVNNNPYLDKSVDAALGRITDQYTDPNGVLSQIRTGAQNAGQYGGSRQGVAEGIAAREYTRALGDTAAQMYSDAYNKGQDTFSRTLATAPSTMQSYMLPAQWQSAVGSQREGLAQALEDYSAAGREWDLNAPWTPLEAYANVVYGGGGSQSVNKTSGGTARNPLLSAVGGGMTGYTIGAALPSLIGGPAGAIAGAVLGGLFS